MANLEVRWICSQFRANKHHTTPISSVQCCAYTAGCSSGAWHTLTVVFVAGLHCRLTAHPVVHSLQHSQGGHGKLSCPVHALLQAVSARWRQQRTGDATQDWPILQQLSCDQPELFWSAVIKELGIKFQTPPTRMLDDSISNPDEVRWLPGMSSWGNHAVVAVAQPTPAFCGMRRVPNELKTI